MESRRLREAQEKRDLRQNQIVRAYIPQREPSPQIFE
jgi:hypothetical protein